MGLPCPRSETEFYQPRKPQESSFYQLVDQYYDEFERIYPEQYEKKYGFWRHVIGDAVGSFLKCGDVQEGFARVRCPDCTHEFFVAFSCRSCWTAGHVPFLPSETKLNDTGTAIEENESFFVSFLLPICYTENLDIYLVYFLFDLRLPLKPLF